MHPSPTAEAADLMSYPESPARLPGLKANIPHQLLLREADHRSRAGGIRVTEPV